MCRVKSFNYESFSFIFCKNTNKILQTNDNFKKMLVQLELKEMDMISCLRTYFNKNGVSLEFDKNILSWNFVEFDNKIIGTGYSSLNLNEKELSQDEFQNAKLITLGEMTAGIVHDINNPLGFIVSNMETLRYEIEELYDDNIIDKDKFEFLEKKLDYIAEGSRRTVEIIDGVKNLVHKEELKFLNEDIVSVIEKSVAITQYKVKKQGVGVKINKPSFEPLLVNCKKGMITQIIVNLIQNSADAIEGLPAFKKWVDISFKEEKHSVKIIIKDGGSGIPLEIQSKLFDAFFTTKEIGKGTGLGLSLSKQIMEAHLGKIYIDNDCKNTCFVLEFPKV